MAAFLISGRFRMGVFIMASEALARPRALLPAVAFFLPPDAFFVAVFLVVALAVVLAVVLVEAFSLVDFVAVLDTAGFLLAAFLSLAGLFALVTAFFFVGDLGVAVADLLVAADFLVFALVLVLLAGDLAADCLPVFADVAFAAAFSAEAVFADAALPLAFFTAAVLLAAARPLAGFLTVLDFEALSFFGAIRGTYPLRLVIGRAELSRHKRIPEKLVCQARGGGSAVSYQNISRLTIYTVVLLRSGTILWCR